MLTRLPLSRHTKVAYRSGADRHPAVAAITTALRSAIPPELTPEPINDPDDQQRSPGAAAILPRE
jgi:hypothetical protein